MKLLLTAVLLHITAIASAQALLNKMVSRFSAQDKPMSETLNLLGETAGVRFSYKTDILQAEKKVYVSVENKSVVQILRLLFKDLYEYEEQQDYIIIKKRSSYFILSGNISDVKTGLAIEDAGIITSSGMDTVTSDRTGYFELKIPAAESCDYITIRKDFYSDAFIEIGSPRDKQYAIQLAAMKGSEAYPEITVIKAKKNESKTAVNALGNTRSTTTNFELGGLFNHNKHNARVIQLAGLINIAGGSLNGAQIAGIHNLVVDTAKGMQLAALINKAEGEVKGIQIAAVNHTKSLRGFQIGIVNISDSSEGYSLGLINLVRNKSGYHQLSVFTSDITNTNVSVKLGNAKLYSVLQAGMNISHNRKLHIAGLGLGHDFLLGSHASLSAEADYNFVNAGSWDNRLLQGKLYMNVQFAKGLSFFAGAVYNRFYSNQSFIEPGYKSIINNTRGVSLYKQSSDWIGWQAGITSSDILWPSRKKVPFKQSKGWLMQGGLAAGIDFNSTKWLAADIRFQRYLVNNIEWLLTGGIHYAPFGYAETRAIHSVTTGLKIMVFNDFYVQADAGATLNKVGYQRTFIRSLAVGWNTGKRTDISIRHENINNMILIRTGYTLWNIRR